MDETDFWAIIERVHEVCNGEMDRKCAILKDEIAKLPKADAEAFAGLFGAKMNRAYDWRLWGAAYVINGGCSDDTFSDFCASLISRGRTAFERALNDPDSLADEDFDESQWFYEGYQYAIADGVDVAAGGRPRTVTPAEPSGTAWEEDAVYGMFPKLAAKFS